MHMRIVASCLCCKEDIGRSDSVIFDFEMKGIIVNYP